MCKQEQGFKNVELATLFAKEERIGQSYFNFKYVPVSDDFVRSGKNSAIQRKTMKTQTEKGKFTRRTQYVHLTQQNSNIIYGFNIYIDGIIGGKTTASDKAHIIIPEIGVNEWVAFNSLIKENGLAKFINEKIAHTVKIHDEAINNKNRENNEKQKQQEMSAEAVGGLTKALKECRQQIKDLEFQTGKLADELQNALDDVEIERDKGVKALARVKTELQQNEQDSVYVNGIIGSCYAKRFGRTQTLIYIDSLGYGRYAHLVTSFYDGIEKISK